MVTILAEEVRVYKSSHEDSLNLELDISRDTMCHLFVPIIEQDVMMQFSLNAASNAIRVDVKQTGGRGGDDLTP